MIGLDLNPIIKDLLDAEGYCDIDLMPLSAYGDSQAPFIVWEETTSTRSSEQYWLRESALSYFVYDTDLSRAKDISKIIENYLNIGDDVGQIKTDSNSPVYTICWSRMDSGNMFPPLERDGFYSIVRTFDIGYIDI